MIMPQDILLVPVVAVVMSVVGLACVRAAYRNGCRDGFRLAKEPWRATKATRWAVEDDVTLLRYLNNDDWRTKPSDGPDMDPRDWAKKVKEMEEHAKRNESQPQRDR